MVEHPLGKGEVHSSILCGSTINPPNTSERNATEHANQPCGSGTEASPAVEATQPADATIFNFGLPGEG